jgi:hypothetical protein
MWMKTREKKVVKAGPFDRAALTDPADQARKKNERLRTAGQKIGRSEGQEKWELERACREEQERLDGLFAQADAWDKAEKIRALIKAYQKGCRKEGIDMGPATKVGQWIRWARRQADHMDPMIRCPPSILDRKPDSFWNILGAPDDWWKYWFPPGGGEAAWATRRNWWERFR